MNPLHIFREFLHSGDKQLLDIFEDYGEEKPESVTVYWMLVWHENGPHDEESLNEYMIQIKAFQNFNKTFFNSTIEAIAYARGLKDNHRNPNYTLGIGLNEQQLCDNLEQEFRIHF